MARRAGLRGNPGTLKELSGKLRALPKTLAAEVAAKAAPEITGLAQSAYDGGQTVYGDARPQGVDGELDLVATGTARAQIRFVAIGTQMRCVLGPKYARYLIGKYKILPIRALPASWRAKLGEVVAETKVKL